MATHTRDDATKRMRAAASHLRFAAEQIEAEAAWIERNKLGTDPAYIAASLASREQEIRRGEQLAKASLQD